WATDHADPERGWELAASMAETDLPINAAANHALGGFRDIDQITWVSALRCPVTFVHGTHDPRPVHTVRALAAHASRARKRVVSDAGHLPWLEQPEQVREILHEIVVNAASG
ncbi:MAG: alpha/beta hydrolase, partial [Propionibacterium sp.]|nr:alpha/beta hydrolase [Propionibacterium sp.]